jgi:hypothetical protein
MNYPDRYPTWISEQAPGYRGPTSGKVLQLAVLVLIAVIAWSWFDTGGAATVDRKPGVSLCEEKGNRPGWRQVCQPEPVSAKR